VPNRVRPRAIVEEVYGFAFPDDLYALSDFARAHPASLSVLDLSLDGPFALVSGERKGVTKGWDPGGDRPRFYHDPPEFFTIAVGEGDGRHWGYWFDDPATGAAQVVSYSHNGALSIAAHGESVFHAVRAHLEALARHAHDSNETDKNERLDELAECRAALGSYGLGDRKEVGAAYSDRYSAAKESTRKPIAKSRTGLGIVVPKSEYRALLGGEATDDPFQSAAFKPNQADVEDWVAKAEIAITEGCPGVALKLGHDLWTYPLFAEQSYDLLDRAYSALGRKVLRDYLKRAVVFRKRSELSR
jgi:Uncharacterised conserved protein (DUF2228)